MLPVVLIPYGLLAVRFYLSAKGIRTFDPLLAKPRIYFPLAYGMCSFG